MVPRGGRHNIIGRIVYSMIFLLFSSLTPPFLALNIDQGIDQILPLVCIIFAHVAIIPPYFHLLFNRKQFYSLLDELQDIVDESV